MLIFLTVFFLSHYKKHWSNETETICLINSVLVLYIKRVKEEKALLQDPKSLLMWDAFKAQLTTKVEDTLASYGIEAVMVPKNMTQLLHRSHHKWQLKFYLTRIYFYFFFIKAFTNL